jgi:hypothetical protein
LEILRPQELRPPRLPNELLPFVEERIVAFALGHPGLRPAADRERALLVSASLELLWITGS